MTAEPDVTVIEALAVLLDMDGTIVDSTQVVEGLWAEFATRFDIDLETLLGYAHGRQTVDTVTRFLPARRDADQIAEAFQREELVRTEGITEIPGARRLLDDLRGARVAVVTSAPRALAEVRLTAAGLPIPDLLVAAEDIPRGKPDPAGYLWAAQRFGVPTEDCLVMEDAEAGIRAGVASGARTVVVGSHRSPTTTALLRVPDLRAVAATVSGDGVIRLQWPDDVDPADAG